MIREDNTGGNVTPVLMAIHSGDTSEVPSGSPYMRQGGSNLNRVISINSGAQHSSQVVNNDNNSKEKRSKTFFR